MTNNRTDTWIDREDYAYPSGALRDSRRRARVLCSDGKFRMARAGIPDTFFTVPARLKVNGRTVHGYISTVEVWKESDVSKLEESTPRAVVYVFRANGSGRNAELLPRMVYDPDFEDIARGLLWKGDSK